MSFSVRLSSVCPPFCRLSRFWSSTQEANFNQRIQVCSNGGSRLFKRGDTYKIEKIHWQNFKIFKIFFSRSIGAITTKLGIKHPWVKWIQVCANERPRPFPRRDNFKIAKLINETFFSGPQCQLQPNFAQSIRGWREFSFVQWRATFYSKGR